MTVSSDRIRNFFRHLKVVEQGYNNKLSNVRKIINIFSSIFGRIFAFYVFVLCLQNLSVNLKNNTYYIVSCKKGGRPFGESFMFITLFYRLRFKFEVKFQPNLVSVGTQRIATCVNARVNSLARAISQCGDLISAIFGQNMSLKYFFFENLRLYSEFTLN